jgi:hypothetical protein
MSNVRTRLRSVKEAQTILFAAGPYFVGQPVFEKALEQAEQCVFVIDNKVLES